MTAGVPSRLIESGYTRQQEGDGSVMANRIVIVNDRMQQGYRYECVAPIGRAFNPNSPPT